MVNLSINWINTAIQSEKACFQTLMLASSHYLKQEIVLIDSIIWFCCCYYSLFEYYLISFMLKLFLFHTPGTPLNVFWLMDHFEKEKYLIFCSSDQKLKYLKWDLSKCFLFDRKNGTFSGTVTIALENCLKLRKVLLHSERYV